MNGRAYHDDAQPGSSTTPACPMCGKRTTVDYVGTPRLEWWCGPCNTSFPDPQHGEVSGRWIARARKLRQAGHRRPNNEEGHVVDLDDEGAP